MTLCTMFLLVALAVGTITSANAAEYSVWDWWTNNQGAGGMVDLNGNPVIPPWGNTRSTWTTDDLWNVMCFNQYFTVPTVPAPGADNVRGYLYVEFAGHREYNYFGWYTPTLADGGGAITRNQLFNGNLEGSSPDGTVSATIPVTAGQKIGFYLDYVPAGKNLTPDSGLYDPAASYFTEDERNGDDATPSLDSEDRSGGPANFWGTDGYRHVRCFKDPRYLSGWSYILCWEDLPMTTDGYDYAGAWDPTDTSSLGWAKPVEPDYNDMICRFEFRLGDTPPPPGTPELSTWLLLGLSLAAVPVLRRRRRS